MKSQEIKIVIPCSESFDYVSVKDIIRCEGLQNYTKVILEDGKTIISSSKIDDYNLALSDFGFFACHKQHVINTQKIKRYHKEGFVEMIDTSVAPVSKRREEEFFVVCLKELHVMSGVLKESKN